MNYQQGGATVHFANKTNQLFKLSGRVSSRPGGHQEYVFTHL